jgi:hypothetical protein
MGTTGYSKLAIGEHHWQAEAMELLDQEWRNRNYKWLFGTIPADQLEPFIVEYPKLKRLKWDYLRSGAVDVVSAELAEFLRSRIHAEFIPIQGLHQGQPYTERQFYIMHLLDRFAAMDLQKSIYKKWRPEAGEGIQSVEKMVLDVSKVNNSAAFVLDELTLKLFRNDICEAILQAGFKGLEFIPTEIYQDVRPM